MEEQDKKEIKQDDEFRLLMPPLSEEEHTQLEKNMLREKNPEESIVLLTWHDILIEGYTRYDICQKHNISFKTVEKEFTDRNEAKLWVINYHLGRRHLPIFVKIELASKRADILRLKEQAKQRMVQASHPKNAKDDAIVNSQKQPENEIKEVNVTKKIAEEIKVGEQTVSRSMQIIKKASEAVKQKLRKREITINEAYQELKKREKELEQLKQSNNESEIEKSMHELKKDVQSKKIRDRILKEIDKKLMNQNDLKFVIARAEEELSNLLQPPATLLLPAPAPTLLLTAPET